MADDDTMLLGAWRCGPRGRKRGKKKEQVSSKALRVICAGVEPGMKTEGEIGDEKASDDGRVGKEKVEVMKEDARKEARMDTEGRGRKI